MLGIVLMFIFMNYKKNKANEAKTKYNTPKATRGQDVPQDTEHVNSITGLNRLKENQATVQSDASKRKPSKKEIQRQQRKEERARKSREEFDRKAALEEQRKKQSFNPRKTKPEKIVYTNLAVSDGRLVICAVGQTYYYHSWEYEGRCFFEFFCEQSKAAKAFNNHSVILDPFCQKDSYSISVDEAKAMEIIEFGELDKELNIISKSIIRFK